MSQTRPRRSLGRPADLVLNALTAAGVPWEPVDNLPATWRAVLCPSCRAASTLWVTERGGTMRVGCWSECTQKEILEALAADLERLEVRRAVT